MAFYHTEAGTSFVPKKKCFAKVGKIIEEKKIVKELINYMGSVKFFAQILELEFCSNFKSFFTIY